MSFTDPISDLITRIRNAQRARKQRVVTPASTERNALLDVLVREGYIAGFETRDVRPGIRETTVELKYAEGKPVIETIGRVSRPGCRRYAQIADLPKVRNGLGIYILSTSRGVMSDHEARAQNVGGEVLCHVF